MPLDEVGREQAARAAELLTGLRPRLIVSSDLSRAFETAQALAALSGLPVRTDARLRETYAGDWQGLTRSELEERFGEALALWSAGSHIRPGGGETRLEVADRMVAAIDAALSEVAPGGTLVVATHGGAARAAIGALLGLPPDHWGALGVLTNCAWSVLVENLGDPRVGEGAAPWRLQEYNAGTLPVPALADDR